MEFRVTYRKIAITMVKHLPVDNDEDFNSKVEYYTGLMERLPRICQVALKAAYVIASKAPPEEQEDYFQEYYLAAHKALTRTGDKVRNLEAFAYNAVTRRRKDIFVYLNAQKRKPAGGLVSLSKPLPGLDGGQLELGETLSDKNSFIKSIESAVDEERIWQILPPDIKPIVKRLNRQKVSPTEWKKLSSWSQVNGNNILETIK